ncbi:MAG: hypothetical protein M1813_007905 [Trichoglossum hirsutum]|nr:MAG: hypothetical protein M1813_007905 [Trichoglossum hirsutum]
MRDWSGRGQHAEYKKNEALPLDYIKVLGARVDEVWCRRVRVARKRIRYRQVELPRIMNEVEHLEYLKHPHIIQLVGTYVQDMTIGILLYPVANWDLKSFLEDTGRRSLPERERAERLRFLGISLGCLSHALTYVHANTRKHGDIKSSNILIKRRDSANNFQVYLADFGLARAFSSDDTSQTDDAVGRTPLYCAPEVYNQDRKGRAADIFSLGAVFAEIWTVIVGKTTDEFFDFRFDPSQKSAAFRNTLSKVKDWIGLLKGKLHKTNDNLGLYSVESASQHLDTVARMLEPAPESRPVALQLVEELGSHNCCIQEREPYAIERRGDWSLEGEDIIRRVISRRRRSYSNLPLRYPAEVSTLSATTLDPHQGYSASLNRHYPSHQPYHIELAVHAELE